jgi:hypothetical protein
MTSEQERKLAAISNRYTRYEVAAIQGETRIRIAYTMRRSRPGLLEACRNNGPEIIKALAVSDSQMLMFIKANGQWVIELGSWVIRFTGRTQREAILAGELVWVGTAAREAG